MNEYDKLATFVYEVNEALWGVENLYTKHANKIVEDYHEAFRQAIIEMFIGLPQRMPPEVWFGDDNLPRKHWAQQIKGLYEKYQRVIAAEKVQESALEKQLRELAAKVELLTTKLAEAETVEPAAPEEKPDEEQKPESEEPEDKDEKPEAGEEV